MRKTIAALLLLAATLPASAVSTNTINLTTSWADLGAGPMQIQTNNQSQAIYNIGDTAPTGAVGFYLQGNGVPQVVNTSSHVYARVRQVPASAVLVYAPVSAASSGGGGGGGGSTTPTTSSGAYAPATVTTTSTQVLPAAAGRVFLDLKNESTSQPIACSFGGPAAINTAGSFTVAPGGDKTWEGSFIPSDQINCITSTGNAPLTVGAK